MCLPHHFRAEGNANTYSKEAPAQLMLSAALFFAFQNEDTISTSLTN
jgi:hypothetical protein